MEFVDGVPVTEYCDDHRLTTRERIELFVRICRGVHHAHQKGIIHRDLKPSNILVTERDGRPAPKIIDFGIAKATAQPLTGSTVFTEHGQLIGTPEYMSPEQAGTTALDVDTRSDVYSLGVLLYRLLAGVLPFDSGELRQAGPDEIRRKIREDDPPRPSTRLSGLDREVSTRITESRNSDPETLVKGLRGDLDWIVMKALEKDRGRRYGSASDLAADLTRHLENRPVEAGPPSAIYRMGKFVRRHRLGVAAAGLVVLALILAVAGIAVGLVRATRAQARATQEAEAARRVSEFLVSLFEDNRPANARGASLTAAEILDRGAERIEGELAGQPLHRARLMSTIGQVYTQLDRLEEAEAMLTEALAVQRRQLGELHPTTVETMRAGSTMSWAASRRRKPTSGRRFASAPRCSGTGTPTTRPASTDSPPSTSTWAASPRPKIWSAGPWRWIATPWERTTTTSVPTSRISDRSICGGNRRKTRSRPSKKRSRSTAAPCPRVTGGGRRR